AALGGGRARGAGLRLAVDAVLHGGHARAHTAGRRAEAFVDLAVAVVVEAIASFGGAGVARGALLLLTVGAVGHGALAGAHPAGGRAEAVVDGAVAVVVDAVAAL